MAARSHPCKERKGGAPPVMRFLQIMRERVDRPREISCLEHPATTSQHQRCLSVLTRTERVFLVAPENFNCFEVTRKLRHSHSRRRQTQCREASP